MKKLLTVCAILFAGCLTLNAQEKDKLKSKDVPEAVRSAFQTEFPEASGVDWMMKDGNYKAKYTISSRQHFAEISSDGKMIARGMKIEKNELPAAVATAWKSTYASEKVNDIYQVEKAGQLHYVIKTKNDKKVMFDATGTQL